MHRENTQRRKQQGLKEKVIKEKKNAALSIFSRLTYEQGCKKEVTERGKKKEKRLNEK